VFLIKDDEPTRQQVNVIEALLEYLSSLKNPMSFIAVVYDKQFVWVVSDKV